MAIHSVSGGGSGLSTIANMGAHQQAAKTRTADSTDTSKTATTAATAKSSPSVNQQGQTVGKIVNTTA